MKAGQLLLAGIQASCPWVSPQLPFLETQSSTHFSFLKSAGSVRSPVPGWEVLVVHTQPSLGQAAVISFGYFRCVKVHICLVCVDEDYC